MDDVLAIEGLTVELDLSRGRFAAVRDVSLTVGRGEIVALVGESGSGKSMTALAVMRLLPEPPALIAAGAIRFRDKDLASAPEDVLAGIRGDRIGMIFQEPMTSLNPSMRAGPQVAEVLALHKGLDGKAARKRVEELFARVRIPDPARRFDDYPHQMSGGMRQRVMIAMAIACDPDLVVADEPTTALDVTTQAQILDIFRAFRDEDGRSTLLITHDLAVVAETADRVAVMYGGRIVETAPVERLFEAAAHPYTRGLIASIPNPDEDIETRGRLTEIAGAVPALWAMPKGCAFSPRCPRATPRCADEQPSSETIAPGHVVACWNREDAR
ncbi:ABC transporter ATP-binding protein [Alsobacter sp. SYSU M60028]|uniref:ABC transporter ATP-binding protein n=1 Tax=Alsobacter ponti TaxID=2962936 RepID=A0ABT1L7V4_9HYPH|nr:ABC transporter ATP-binding protein [Alsobacter ponti]MCP8937577.1 ABC transporter ATP-binding protein [Alsobacter ponti]